MKMLILITSVLLIFTACEREDLFQFMMDNTGYKIGDTGPAGGIIFYNKGHYSDGWQYLEAASSDQSAGAAWSDVIDAAVGTGAQNTAIGTGFANSNAIVSQVGHTASAAKICLDYTVDFEGVTYDDWFLPSKDELNRLYLNLYLQGLGGFTTNFYWSSSEDTEFDSAFNARALFFSDGSHHASNKNDNTRRVRAIRAF